MPMKKLINSVLFLLITLTLHAQRCAHGVVADEQLRRRHENFQRVLDSHSRDNVKNLRVQDEIIRIPVVVHVIHNNRSGIIGGDGNTNISDA